MASVPSSKDPLQLSSCTLFRNVRSKSDTLQVISVVVYIMRILFGSELQLIL